MPRELFFPESLDRTLPKNDLLMFAEEKGEGVFLVGEGKEV
jgi:hypothetical protein